jgi:hypothetical protein
MANLFSSFWRRFFGEDRRDTAEVDRIHSLQKAAAARRAEHALKQEQAATTGDSSLPGPESSSWKRMKEAESAHIAALQKWENKQARQKSR